MSEPTYLEQRLQKLGITDPEQYTVKNYHYGRFHRGEEGFTETEFKIFQEDEKGNIRIYYPSLEGLKLSVEKRGNKNKIDYFLTRLKEPEGDMKYKFISGTGHQVFIPPLIIDKYQKSEKIETLVLTEGAFKAFSGSLHGLPIMGLASITGMKDRVTLGLHEDIKEVIRKCDVKRILYLVDGDCHRLTRKPLEDPKTDLRTRPFQFFNSVLTLSKFLEEFTGIEKCFAHVLSDQLNELNNPKGLDDLLESMKGDEQRVINDLLNFHKSGNWKYFHKIDFTSKTNQVFNYFHLHNVDSFFHFYYDQRPEIKQKEFRWNGSTYRYNEEKNTCEVRIPGDASCYMRVGNDYYEWYPKPNKYGETEMTYSGRNVGTITTDYGKDFLKHIVKYKAFCNKPSHDSYEQIIHNCYNMYAPFTHEPEEGSCETIMALLRHIFGTDTIKYRHPNTGEEKTINELDLGLDFIQLLYQRPTQILPILCLVSRENQTGKSTFCKFLKMIFTNNATIVGNADLANDFNAFWVSKLLIICDEAKIDKQHVVEKIKALSTADRITLNAKGKDQNEIDFFGKFILNSNYEEEFIYANENDIRFWVRKVPVIHKVDPNLEEKLLDEIPAFLHMLNNRKVVSENLTRMWFHQDQLKTDALRRIVERNRPSLEKELRYNLRELFFQIKESEIKMTIKDIQREFLGNKTIESDYIRRILRDYMKAAVETKVTERYSYPKLQNQLGSGDSLMAISWIKGNGRPYTFKVFDFLTEEEVGERNRSLQHQPEGADLPF